ncbi:MAG: ABC transporter ATP-binding protein [Planctomycetota bacterium]
MSKPALIETKGLGKSFGPVRAVHDLSLRVERGSITGFLGLNGSGKSTTLRIILGLLAPDQGSFELFGANDRRGRAAALGRIGALVDSAAFYPRLTGRQNIRFLSGLGGYQGEVDEVLEQVGLSDAADRPARHYSLGMKQRLAIALALVGQPELIILDEPTNGLDPNGIMEMRRLIQKLNRESGVTFFISSHLIHEIELICDHVIMIESGQLVFADRMDALQSRLKGRFSLNCASKVDADRALELLGQDDDCLNVKRIPSQQIKFEISPDQLGRLHRDLVKAGVEIRTLAEVRVTLEEFFLSQSSLRREGSLT